jgi:hypothetical protein
MSSIRWDAEIADVYDETYAAMFEPSELDLMRRLTGFRLRDRWAGWDREPFTPGSQHQVAVFERLSG